MIKLLEDEIELMCREEEVDYINSIKRECENEYSDFMKKETGDDYNCKLSVIEDIHLTNANGARCGGVILLAHKRRIVCSNTLEDRLNLVFEQELPRLRNGLFPKEK